MTVKKLIGICCITQMLLGPGLTGVTTLVEATTTEIPVVEEVQQKEVNSSKNELELDNKNEEEKVEEENVVIEKEKVEEEKGNDLNEKDTSLNMSVDELEEKPQKETEVKEIQDTAYASITGKWGTTSFNYNPDAKILFLTGGVLGKAENSPWNTSKIGYDVSHISLSNVTAPADASFLFSSSTEKKLTSLLSITGTLHVNSSTENLEHMFDGTNNLRDLAIGMKDWDTRAVKTYDSMFSRAYSLRHLDLTGWTVSGGASMFGMFFAVRLQTLTTGSAFNFASSGVQLGSPMLEDNVGEIATASGNWQRKGSSDTYTPEEFINPSTTIFPGTYVAELEKWGTSPWVFNEETGVLTLGDGTLGTASTSPWNTSKIKATDIKEIRLNGSVSAGNNADNLFAVLPETTALTALEKITGSLIINNKTTTMSRMFNGASSLTSVDVSKFDTSNVTDMSRMFYGTSSLTSVDVSKFDTSNVTDMLFMFYGASSLTSLDLNGWNTSKVKDMGTLFYGTGLTSLDLSSWDTGNVTNMFGMFGKLKLQTLTLGSAFRFRGTTLGNIQLGSPSVSNTEEQGTGNWIREDGNSIAYTPIEFLKNYGKGDLVAGTYVAEKELWGTSPWKFDEKTGVLTLEEGILGTSEESPWNTEKIASELIKEIKIGDAVKAPANSSYLFSSMGEKPLSKLEKITGQLIVDETVTNMSYMFSRASSLSSVDVSKWDTSKVTDMSLMYNGASSLSSLDVSKWNTSQVAEIYGMFTGASSLRNLDLTNWNTEKVSTMSAMFNGLSLQTLTLGEHFKFAGSNVGLKEPLIVGEGTATGNWTREDGKSIGYPPAEFIENYGTGDLVAGTYVAEKQHWGTSPWVFDEKTGVLTLGDGTLGTTLESPWNDSKLDPELIKEIKVGDAVKAPADSSYLFSSKREKYLSKLEKITGQLIVDETVTSMDNVFQNASSLASIDVSNWNTSKVTTMFQMFVGASSLVSIDVSKWDTSQVTNMSSVFYKASSLASIDVSKWNTSKVTNMRQMFCKASSLASIDVSNWDTSKVAEMELMFAEASSLTSVDVSKWDTSQVKSMIAVFRASSLASIDLSNWDTSQVESMLSMFKGVSLQTLTLGEHFKFAGSDDVGLKEPLIVGEGTATGKWTREDGKSKGYTPDEFVANYGTDDLVAGTYVAEVVRKQANLAIDFKVEPKDSSLNVNTVGEISNSTIELSNNGEDNSVAENLVLDHFETQFEISSKDVIIESVKADGTTTTETISKEELQKGYQFENISKGDKISIHYEAIPWNNSNQESEAEDTIRVAYSTGNDENNQAIFSKTTQIESGNFGFIEVPEVVEFKTTPLSVDLNNKLIDRVDSAWGISLEDYRGTNNRNSGSEGVPALPDRQDWELTAIAGLFKDTVNNELSTSVLSVAYVNDGGISELSDQEVSLESHSVENETPKKNHEIKLKWNEDEGLKVKVNNRNDLKTNMKYQAQIDFELRMAP